MILSKDFRNALQCGTVLMDKDEVIFLVSPGCHPIILSSSDLQKQALDHRHAGSCGTFPVGHAPQGDEAAAILQNTELLLKFPVTQGIQHIIHVGEDFRIILFPVVNETICPEPPDPFLAGTVLLS